MKTTQFISQLFEHVGIEINDVKKIETEKEVVIEIEVSEDDAGFLIGKHAETLLSLQRIVRMVEGANDTHQKRLILDVNQYRQRKKDKTLKLLSEVAEKVIESGKAHTVPHSLTAVERFYIHSSISEDEKYSGLTSYSIGEGQFRRVVIDIKSKEMSTESYGKDE